MNYSIDLSKIPVFLSVAKHLSFSEAAYELYTTQSSISKSIAILEASLDYPLFIRKNRKIALTPAGHFLYNELSKTVQDMEQIFKDAGKIHAGKTGSFTIGIAGYLAKTPKFQQICSAFSIAYPEFEFNLKSLDYQDLKKALNKGDVDAILYHSSELSLQPNIKYILLMKSEPILICNPFATADSHTSIEDFKDARYICVDPALVPGNIEYLVNVCNSYGFTPNIAKHSLSMFETVQYISNSNYVTITDRSIFTIPATDLRVIPIEPKQNFPNVDTVFAWLDTNVNPVLQRFISTTAKEITING